MTVCSYFVDNAPNYVVPEIKWCIADVFLKYYALVSVLKALVTDITFAICFHNKKTLMSTVILSEK